MGTALIRFGEVGAIFSGGLDLAAAAVHPSAALRTPLDKAEERDRCRDSGPSRAPQGYELLISVTPFLPELRAPFWLVCTGSCAPSIAPSTRGLPPGLDRCPCGVRHESP